MHVSGNCYSISCIVEALKLTFITVNCMTVIIINDTTSLLCMVRRVLHSWLLAGPHRRC